MEKKRFERELEAKLQSEKLAAQLELERLQLERAKVERKNIEARAEVQSAASSQAGQDTVAAVTKTPGLPGFVDGKDNLDNYLLRFERYATISGWQRDAWAVRLSPLLTGKALDVYSELSSEDARGYDKLRKALLQRYDFTEQGYRERFRKAKSDGQESPGQLIVRIRNYFNKWVELSEVGKTFEGVEELMVQEQFTNSCPRDVSIFLKERKLKNLEELAQMAEQYLDAHNKKLSSKTMVARQDVRDNKLVRSGSQKDVLRCFACDGRGHRAVDCPNRAWTSRNELNSRFRRSYCYKCGSSGHDTKDCQNLSHAPSQLNDQEDEVPVALRLKIFKSLARCKCHGGQKRRRLKEEWILWS